MLMMHSSVSITSRASQQPKNHAFSLPFGFSSALYATPPLILTSFAHRQLQPSLSAGFRNIVMRKNNNVARNLTQVGRMTCAATTPTHCHESNNLQYKVLFLHHHHFQELDYATWTRQSGTGYRCHSFFAKRMLVAKHLRQVQWV